MLLYASEIWLFCIHSAYELLFCDTTSGRQITNATELRDVKWATWTCTLGKH
jgi:hypothetical protein